MNIFQKIKVFWFQWIVHVASLDRYFRKKKAILRFTLPQEATNPDGSFQVVIEDMKYYFEMKPKIIEYTSMTGQKRKEFIYNYGGWELDLHK